MNRSRAPIAMDEAIKLHRVRYQRAAGPMRGLRWHATQVYGWQKRVGSWMWLVVVVIGVFTAGVAAGERMTPTTVVITVVGYAGVLLAVLAVVPQYLLGSGMLWRGEANEMAALHLKHKGESTWEVHGLGRWPLRVAKTTIARRLRLDALELAHEANVNLLATSKVEKLRVRYVADGMRTLSQAEKLEYGFADDDPSPLIYKPCEHSLDQVEARRSGFPPTSR